MHRKNDALDGVSERERTAMLALLKMKPERQRAAQKADTAKGRAQRRRREQERRCPSAHPEDE